MSVGEGSTAGTVAVDPLRKSGLAASEILRRDLGSAHQLVPALERSRAAEAVVELPPRGKPCERAAGTWRYGARPGDKPDARSTARRGSKQSAAIPTARRAPANNCFLYALVIL